ncbi:MAG: histidine phosphatase family protein [Acidobacteria bacterium]|nr:histidine phosphatase family protein [Acidobacteriota bacterium]MCH7901620.1 histidine phosphatase family protein [Acidobacteriota bacterium]MCH8970770.1 histidine phosphatase family protein [Acidobacteriota bacterium]MCZ6740481.1 histidine phosphatase family protein [Actinomycetota bacterium]TDI51915.1 MAG: histidine phosphatase family protein [Acidobacteriota bacterium]
MPTLMLMRHAKSDWDVSYGADHDRPLSQRGVRSARLMGRLVAGTDLIPDLVISSTAIRARTTAQLAAESGAWGCSIDLESGFYGTGPDTVLTRASDAPDVDRLMLVGHQPTWSMLVQRLTGARAEMKTASVAIIDMMIETWAELKTAQGILTSLHHPRSYFGSEWDDAP